MIFIKRMILRVQRSKSNFLLSLLLAGTIFICLYMMLNEKIAESQPLTKVPVAQIVRRSTGLNTEGPKLLLNGEEFRILSGAIHYFRIPHQYWKDRLLKAKKCGLNTVETYVPWNLHEENPGEFNFTQNLDIVHFINLAKELGLRVIVRPGPYICSEWDWGGHPAWLLRDEAMKVRTLYPGYTKAVEKYFAKLIPLLVPLQFQNGGPIIAVQVENEYGGYGNDKDYLRWLMNLNRKLGIVELLFTSDGAEFLARGSLPEMFATVNNQLNLARALDLLSEFQRDRPYIVTEFWSGWFDHWGEAHQIWDQEKYVIQLVTILSRGGSVNIYMFHGGTNFGFMNGANHFYEGDVAMYQPDVTSYDYDAPLNESGHPTRKYYATLDVMRVFNGKFVLDEGDQSDFMERPMSESYGTAKLKDYVSLTTALELVTATTHKELNYMENLCSGKSYDECKTQNFGFTVEIQK